jgi:hypothetical protein
MSQSSGQRTDRVLFPGWLIAFALGPPLALIVLAASPIGANFFYVMIGIPFLLLAWATAAVCAAIFGARRAMRKRWRQGLAAFLLPLCLLLVARDPIRFVHSCNYIGDVTHFILAWPYYDYRVAHLPANQTPRLAVFNWGGMVWASHGVVYDESDQITLARDRQTADWLAQASGTELSCDGYHAQPLWAHYYLVDFPC